VPGGWSHESHRPLSTPTGCETDGDAHAVSRVTFAASRRVDLPVHPAPLRRRPSARPRRYDVRPVDLGHQQPIPARLRQAHMLNVQCFSKRTGNSNAILGSTSSCARNVGARAPIGRAARETLRILLVCSTAADPSGSANHTRWSVTASWSCRPVQMTARWLLYQSRFRTLKQACRRAMSTSSGVRYEHPRDRAGSGEVDGCCNAEAVVVRWRDGRVSDRPVRSRRGRYQRRNPPRPRART